MARFSLFNPAQGQFLTHKDRIRWTNTVAPRQGPVVLTIIEGDGIQGFSSPDGMGRRDPAAAFGVFTDRGDDGTTTTSRQGNTQTEQCTQGQQTVFKPAHRVMVQN